MRIPRIFQSIPLTADMHVELDAQATTHLAKVLRLRTGDELLVFNGNGGEYRATVESLERRSASIRIGEYIDRNVESPLELVLVQGISRGERMDYTVQKAVELGVTRIVPVITERTVVNLKGERQQRRLEHWQGVVRSACEQCGRTLIPDVQPVIPLHDWLNSRGEGARFVLHHRTRQGFPESVGDQHSVTLLIGPEGGLSPEEISAAQRADYIPLSLGPRVLRTETAAVTALSILQWTWGDLGA